MAEEIYLEDPQPRSRLGRNLLIVLAGLLVLLVVLYFVVSSGAFLKGVILPRAGKSLNAEITVTDASLSPFSQITLENLRVQPIGAEPLLTAQRVRVRYKLLSILRGNYAVDEVTLTSPTIQLVTDPNGKSNLDPLLEGQESAPGKKTEERLRLALRNVSITDGTVRTINRAKDGSSNMVELSSLNVNLDRVENGQAGKASLAAGIRLDHRIPPNQPGTNDLMEGKVDGNFEFALDQNLLPQTLTGNANVAFGRAEGAYEDLTGLAAVLQADVTPTEVRQLGLRFERGGQRLGRIQASGPIDLAKSEGRLKLEVQSIDRQVLNLFGAPRGWDFADSTLNATNYVDVARQGEVIGARGQVTGRQVSIRQQDGSTPPLDLDVDYEVSVNRQDQTVVIRKLTLAGQQQQQELLQASLDRPMTLTWAATARGFADSTFRLALTQLNLADWHPVLGTNLPSGRVDWQLSMTATNDAKRLTAKSRLTIQDFSAQFDTNRLEQADVNVRVEGILEDFKKLKLDPFVLEVQQLKQPLVKGDGLVNYDFSTANLNLQANAELALPAILRHFPVPSLAASNGSVRLSSAVTQRNHKYVVTGNLLLRDFTGSYGDYQFRDFQSSLDYNVDLEHPTVQIHSAALTLRKGYSSGGNVVVTGNYDLNKSAARLNFTVVDINEHALGPFLAPSLGEKKLVSILLNGSGSGNYDPNGETSIKTELSLTNWVVAAPQQQFTSPNLSARVQLDGSMQQETLDLRQLVLKLTPTARAGNELQIKGRLHLAATNPAPSQLSIQSEALDVTRYYEIFAGTPTEAAPSQPAPAPAPAPPVQEVEPEPVSLPFQQLTTDLKFGRIYLQDLAITNFQTTARINRGEVTVPFDFTLNGGAVSGNAMLNLGVPGYTYDMAFKADRVPIEPLSSTFTTNAPGQYTGNLIAQAQLRGAGLTGPSLQKNLNGNLSLSMTNMNYEIIGRKAKQILTPIALVLRVPELTQTPLNWIGAKAEIGRGQIEIQQFTVQSEAFYAESRGTIPMAEVLTNSPLKLPVNISLRRSLAEKANLIPANAPTNTVYTQLPTFVTLTGTVGDPKSDINKVVIAGLLARSIGGIGQVGEQAGSVLQGLGSALTGQPGARGGTNAPAATNASPAGAIVQGLSGLLNQARKERADTNAPAAGTNKPARFNPFDLLKPPPEKK